MKIRYAYPPYPVGWVSEETLKGYVEGDDPVTGKPLLPEMVDALTRPLSDGEAPETEAAAAAAAPADEPEEDEAPRPTEVQPVASQARRAAPRMRADEGILATGGIPAGRGDRDARAGFFAQSGKGPGFFDRESEGGIRG